MKREKAEGKRKGRGDGESVGTQLWHRPRGHLLKLVMAGKKQVSTLYNFDEEDTFELVWS